MLPTIHGGSNNVDIELIEWSTIDEGVEEIVAKVESSGFKPDVIVGILRGGVIPARLVADRLGVNDITVMEVKLYKGTGIRGERPYLRQPPVLSLTDKRVLIVDDISDSGLTLQLAVEAVNLFMPKEVRTASIYIKPWTEFVPDYYAFTTRNWIVFPWERGEYARGE
ncbi:MAG: phosphoribosyltransferase [Crenarchaeota archaeon]|nr:phosphoribosyltransferase [Thermoproteota archaeon]